MPNIRRFLSRRWLLVYLGVGAILFSLAMLHPYPRQSLFGPKIAGVPWCVWEIEIRRAADPRGSRTWYISLLEKAGLLEPPSPMDGPEFLPLFLHFANDDDFNVRRHSLWKLDRYSYKEEFWRWSEDEEAQILPVVRQHLQDDDPMCRLICAEYLWRATKDPEMIKVPYAHLEHPDFYIRQSACIALCYLAEADPDSFEPIQKMVWEDPRAKLAVRQTAMQTMRHFGKRGIPTIKKGMADPDIYIHGAALFALERMGDDAKELRPEIIAMQNHSVAPLRRRATALLNRIDGKRLPAE